MVSRGQSLLLKKNNESIHSGMIELFLPCSLRSLLVAPAGHKMG